MVEKDNVWKCPYCANQITREVIVCHHCWKVVPLTKREEQWNRLYDAKLKELSELQEKLALVQHIQMQEVVLPMQEIVEPMQGVVEPVLDEPLPAPARGQLKPCPYCAEQILENAIECPFCDSGISLEHYSKCWFCSEMIKKDSSMCSYCNTPLPFEPPPAGPENDSIATKRDRPTTQIPRARPVQDRATWKGVRDQVLEVIVRQAMAGAPWQEICAGPMLVNDITVQDVETELRKRGMRHQSQPPPPPPPPRPRRPAPPEQPLNIDGLLDKIIQLEHALKQTEDKALEIASERDQFAAMLSIAETKIKQLTEALEKLNIELNKLNEAIKKQTDDE
jgi:hypothetical protein